MIFVRNAILAERLAFGGGGDREKTSSRMVPELFLVFWHNWLYLEQGLLTFLFVYLFLFTAKDPFDNFDSLRKTIDPLPLRIIFLNA